MLREEFVEKLNFHCKIDGKEVWVNIMPLIKTLFDDHEAQLKALDDKYAEAVYIYESAVMEFHEQLKAKDEEIDRLKTERDHFYNKYIQVGEHIGEWVKGTKARSIVAMLFWMMKRQKAIYIKSFNEIGINNHNTSFYKGAYENSKMRFKQAYKMLKDNA